ncbi:hypothetical protein E2P81_ATG09981 [Venturia nashicola]|nr:hypothetical protein E2P81_ATG09981 [Venturia nashicola]
MSHLHERWRKRPSSSGFPHVPILEPIDDASEPSFTSRGRARSSSLGFGIFSERHLDLYLQGETFTSDPADEIVPKVDTFTSNPANEIKALAPAIRFIVPKNYITLSQVLEHQRLDWLVYQRSLTPMLEQDDADPEVDLAASWELSTSSFLNPYKREDERSGNTKPNISHAQSCGEILEESDTQEAVRNWNRLSGFLRARRAKSEASVATKARGVTIESQRKREGRGRWRRVKAFFSRK